MSERTTNSTPASTPPKRGRYPQSALALVGAIIGCLGIVAFLVLVVVRPDGGMRESTDWHAVAGSAQSAYDPDVLDPQLPEGWTANYARVATQDGVLVWEIGFLSPSEGYVGLRQMIAVEPEARITLPDAIGEATGVVRVDGRDWTEFDRRAIDPTGNYALSLLSETPSSVVLLHGSATDADFSLVAAAIGAEVAR